MVTVGFGLHLGGTLPYCTWEDVCYLAIVFSYLGIDMYSIECHSRLYCCCVCQQAAGIQPPPVVGRAAAAGDRCSNGTSPGLRAAGSRSHSVHGARTWQLCAADHCILEAVSTSWPTLHAAAQSRLRAYELFFLSFVLILSFLWCYYSPFFQFRTRFNVHT